MSAPGGQRPPPGPYGRYRPPPTARPANPYPSDFTHANYDDDGSVFRTGSYLHLDNMSLRTIDVRTQPSENSALVGNRSERELYWRRQLEWNMNNWRRGNLGVIQIDKDRRLWGVALRCELSWEVLRRNPNPPCISMIWDNDLGEFSLYCSQRGDGHFVLSENDSV